MCVSVCTLLTDLFDDVVVGSNTFCNFCVEYRLENFSTRVTIKCSEELLDPFDTESFAFNLDHILFLNHKLLQHRTFSIPDMSGGRDGCDIWYRMTSVCCLLGIWRENGVLRLQCVVLRCVVATPNWNCDTVHAQQEKSSYEECSCKQ